jgi:hypothetical protein
MVMHRRLKRRKCLERRQHEKRKSAGRKGEIVQIKQKRRKALRTRDHKKGKEKVKTKTGKHERIKTNGG